MKSIDFSLLELVPDDLIETHNLLLAWVDWGRSRRKVETCGSAEKNYRAPWRQWHYPDLYASSKQIPDFRGIEIERAVQQLPERHRNVIRLWYIRRAHPGVIRGAAGVPFKELSDFLNSGRRMVRNILRTV